MRSIVLGAAALALGLSTSAAFAGPVWFAKESLATCAFLNLIGNVKQANCAIDVVGDDGKSNDDNAQIIKQENKAFVKKLGYGTMQLNLGGNVVVEGDDNTQKIKQSNFYKSGSYKPTYSPVQTNTALNVVEDGDDNYQSIEQSNTLVVGGGGGGGYNPN